MAYEYRVIMDYEGAGFYLAEGDFVADDFFAEPDIPAALVGRGVLEPADMDAEAARIAAEAVDEDDDE